METAYGIYFLANLNGYSNYDSQAILNRKPERKWAALHARVYWTCVLFVCNESYLHMDSIAVNLERMKWTDSLSGFLTFSIRNQSDALRLQVSRMEKFLSSTMINVCFLVWNAFFDLGFKTFWQRVSFCIFAWVVAWNFVGFFSIVLSSTFLIMRNASFFISNTN